MKKSLIALAALAAAGAASAQSSVTLFGVVDVGVQNISADRAATAFSADGKNSVTRITSGAESTSRLGLRGTEDLGGGLSASFWLEAQFAADDGTGSASTSTNRSVGSFISTNGANAPVRSGTQGLTFNRRTTVSLAGGFGELRLGRDFVPAFLNHTTFDPFGTVGGGAATNISLALGNLNGIQTTTRASNSVQYFLPGNLGGFYGNIMHARGEVVSPVNSTVTSASVIANGFTESSDGTVNGLRFGYAAGPLNVAYGYTKSKQTGGLVLADAALAGGSALANQSGATTPTAANQVFGGAYINQNVGASYDFGVAKLMGAVNQEKVEDNTGSAKHKTWMIGTAVPVGAGVIKASYGRGKSDGDAMKGNQLAIGYVHSLSKRTAVYTTYSRLNNSGNLAALNYTQAANSVSPTALNGNSRAIDLGLRHSF